MHAEEVQVLDPTEVLWELEEVLMVQFVIVVSRVQPCSDKIQAIQRKPKPSCECWSRGSRTQTARLLTQVFTRRIMKEG